MRSFVARSRPTSGCRNSAPTSAFRTCLASAPPRATTSRTPAIGRCSSASPRPLAVLSTGSSAGPCYPPTRVMTQQAFAWTRHICCSSTSDRTLDKCSQTPGSNTWGTLIDDGGFSGELRASCSLARVPQPRIGSFRFYDDGSIMLTNRPLLCSVMILENDGAPRTMQPDDTFPSAETFVSEMLTFNDNRFLSQPNAAFTENDCREQMAVKTLLRDISHRYINREYSHGLFLLQLTDLHANNIFIDDEWNVTCLIDLEWICSLPAPMLRVPYWLTGLSIDEIEDEKYVEFDSVRKEFLSELEQVEMQNEADHGVPISQLMEDTWQSKSVVLVLHIVSQRNVLPAGTTSVLAAPGCRETALNFGAKTPGKSFEGS